jgi:hypothetical protein
MTEASAEKYFDKFRNSDDFNKSQGEGKMAWSTKSIVADPKLMDMEHNDCRLQPGSPAVDAGMPLPAEWPDPLRSIDAGAPDIGALPLNAPPMQVGR